MIKDFVEKFEKNKEALRAKFAAKHPDNYAEVVKNVIEILREESANKTAPDPERIHQIDDGNYQGTLVYIIAECGYQPDIYWYVKVSYGSCFACDILEGIRRYDSDQPSEQQVKDYMILALHIIQGLKLMN
jgi:hypothetical protein